MPCSKHAKRHLDGYSLEFQSRLIFVRAWKMLVPPSHLMQNRYFYTRTRIMYIRKMYVRRRFLTNQNLNGNLPKKKKNVSSFYKISFPYGLLYGIVFLSEPSAALNARDCRCFAVSLQRDVNFFSSVCKKRLRCAASMEHKNIRTRSRTLFTVPT